jgi:hypothetical protein
MSMMLDVLFVRDSGRTVFSVTCRVDDKAVCTPMFSRDQTMFGAALQQAIVDLVQPAVPRASDAEPHCVRNAWGVQVVLLRGAGKN